MNSPLPIDQRIAPDNAPLREWLSRTPKVWEKRLARHAITGECVDSQGISVGEKVARVCHRFSPRTQDDARQDAKLTYLLDTCQDPRSAGAVWLRAVLPWSHNSLSKVEQLECLSQRLMEKIAQVDGKERLGWATLATRAGAQICKPQRARGAMDEDIERAMVDLMATAWKSLPENLVHQGRSMLPADSSRTGTPPAAWHPMYLNFIDMLSLRSWHSPTPPELLPLQLWMIPAFDDLSIVDQGIAKTHYGLVPNSLIGHRAFLEALEGRVSWPNDPRTLVAVEWARTHNPHLAPLVEAVALDHGTPSEPSTTKARARL